MQKMTRICLSGYAMFHPGLVEDTWDFDEIYLMKNGNTNLEEVLSFYSFDTCHDFLLKYIW